jgi:hypothetical protein
MQFTVRSEIVLLRCTTRIGVYFQLILYPLFMNALLLVSIERKHVLHCRAPRRVDETTNEDEFVFALR